MLAQASSQAANQRVFSWGACLKGQLGIGVENQGMSIPTEVTSFADMEIKCLAAGAEKSALINSYGELFTFGSSKNQSMLASDGTAFKDNLKLPVMFESETLTFSKVAVGLMHIAAITEDGRLLTMGTIEHGKLGHSEKVKSEQEIKEEKERYRKAGYRPGQLSRSAPEVGFVEGPLLGKKVVEVACGDKHTVCVTEDGQVYSWGSGKRGALGHSESNDNCGVPTLVEGISNAVRVACGTDHTLVLDAAGKLYSFGENTYG